MSTAIANATLPMERDSIESVISNQTKADLKLNRVIFTVADTITLREKHAERSTKGFGGVFRPELKTLKHNGNPGMIYRCKLTVLQEKMDAQNKDMVPPNDVKNWETGYTQSNSKFDPLTGTWGDLEVKSTYMVFKPRYPGNEVRRAVERTYPNGVGGVVEITALKGATRGEVLAAQNYYFPNWGNIQKGIEALPVTVREIQEHITSRLKAVSTEAPADKAEQYALIGREMLQSCTTYQLYLTELVKSEQTTQDSEKVAGHPYSYSPMAEMALEQGELTRKDDIANSQASSTEDLVREMRADRSENADLRRRELDLEERKIALEEAKLGKKPEVAVRQSIEKPIEYGVEDVAGALQQPDVDVRLCGKPKASGEACQRVLKDDEVSCFQHPDKG